jgi:hypothetical protein
LLISRTLFALLASIASSEESAVDMTRDA